jgi:hypothetical protein
MSLAAMAAFSGVMPFAFNAPTMGSEWKSMGVLTEEIIIGVESIPAKLGTTRETARPTRFLMFKNI